MAVAVSYDDVSTVVSRRQRANGFAVIISNDCAQVEGLEELRGTHIDATLMESTFEKLNFAVLHRCNVTSAQLMELFTCTANCRYPPSYRRIAIVFSGHGADNDQLYGQDGKLVKINDMFQLFFPERTHHLGNVPKLFFIDACRGCAHGKMVVVPRGGEEKKAVPVPEQGNYLVAYSTIPGHLSYEVRDAGGVWMPLLASTLLTEDVSVHDVLTKVNEKLLRKYEEPGWVGIQQPECLSRLNEGVYLLREASRIPEKEEEGEEEEDRAYQLHCGGGGIVLHQSLQPFTTPRATWPSAESPQRGSLPRNKMGPPTHFGTPPSPCGSTSSSSSKGGSPQSYNSSPPQVPMAMLRGMSARQRLEQFCIQKKKAKPKIESEEVEPGQFVARVYAAQTCGWVTGDPKPQRDMAEEDAAAKLLAKRSIH